MSKRLAVSIVAAMAAAMLAPLLRAQTAAPQAAAAQKWNNIPPPLSDIQGQKAQRSGAAP